MCSSDLATIVGGLLVGYLAQWATGASGDALGGLRVGLFAAVLATVPATLVYARIESRPTPDPRAAKGLRALFRPPRIEDRRLLFRLTFPSAVVGLGAGLTIPFLNLYFRDRFSLQPGEIGEVFGTGQVLTTGAFLVGPAVAQIGRAHV